MTALLAAGEADPSGLAMAVMAAALVAACAAVRVWAKREGMWK